MIYSSEFRLDHDRKEIFPFYSEDFPYVCMCVTINYFVGRGWHWHPAFEIDYVLEGDIVFQTPEGKIHLSKGDAIFINSNVIHDAHSANKDQNCKIYAILFGSSFLSGMYGSIFEKKYMFPLMQCRELSIYKIQPNTPHNISMLETLLKAVAITDKEEFGYEFEVRSALSKLWCMLLDETAKIRTSHQRKNNMDFERLKDMIQYIHVHYMEKITIKDIANAANISDRECSRCFRRCLNTPPAVYLNNYRITMSAKLLLQSNDSILNICMACGFSSSSYFGKLFRKTMGCTPRKYRENSQN